MTEVFQGISPSTRLCPHWSHPYVVDGRQSGINQAFSEHTFQDSSEPLFSMFLKIGEEEDNKMVERWQKDAKEILLFVSPVSPFIQIHHKPECNRRVYSLP